MDIFLKFIVPILIVGGIAIALGFSLSYLGDKMAVDRDPRIDEIERNLSGANCGGCGYAGCSQFAEALFKGDADLGRCHPTSAANKKNIAKILGKEADTTETVAVVHCNGGNHCKDKYSYQGFGDCISAELIAGGSKACEFGCMGLSSCANVCPNGSAKIDTESGVSKVNPSTCISCGACIAACPKKLIGRIPKDAKVYIACSNLDKGKDIVKICEFGCIACGKCSKTCPTKAIELSNNLAAIDYDKCIGCGECAKVCPRHCIVERN